MKPSQHVGWTATIEPVEDTYAPLRTQNFAKDSTLLVFDANHAAYRSIHTRTLTTTDGVPTSALHGLIEIAMAACSAANTSKFIFVWDGGIAYKRKVHPAYKIRHDRDRTPEEQAQHEISQESIRVAKDGLAMLGIPTARHADIEGDDLIGIIAGAVARPIEKNNRSTSGIERVLIVTDDKDHYQLLSPRTHIWRGVTKSYVTVDSFRSKYALRPDQWADYKALVGEPATGDNIPGVKGIGDVKAGQLIGAHGDLEAAITYAQSRVAAGRPKPLAIEVALAEKAGDARLSLKLSRIMSRPSHGADWWGLPADSIAEEAKRAILYALATRPLKYATLLKFMSMYQFTQQTIDAPTFAKVLGFELTSR